MSFTAQAVSLVNPATGLGVVSGSHEVDMIGVARRKREMVEASIALHLANLKPAAPS